MIERVLLSAEASSLRRHVVAWHRLPADAGASRPFPPDLDDAIAAALRADGIQALYVHQALAFAAATAGRDVVVVTPTASGKSLCYNLPVLQTLRRDPSACALYLFPAKALARDQAATLTALATAAGVDAPVWAYDGDTPTSARAQARRSARILLTNPDMLHVSLLPHHRLWTRFLAGLRFVVVDELHVYRGVFGSHVANVFRRLLRVCRHYGADPRFVACSATIANPGELASALCGRAVECVSENGAPRGERHFLVYNPPLVDRRRGLRRNPLGEARRWAALFLRHRVPTVVFSRSRLSVEVLAARLTEDAARFGLPPGAVAAYRGGYLPDERRSIERGLREGRVQLVVSTNALELGVDIGQLQACVLHGYPGAVASTWQQAGRAGRRGDTSATVLVAGPGALDQYIARNPSFLLGASPEAAYIHADNPRILASHARCAAFELPFRPGERFGALAAVAAAPAHGGPDNSGVGRKAPARPLPST
ncbi:MAG: DEAD/DEAH box helicase [Clostridia bacterium]|nr:DEAD/DEAH box helicase [Clostridia bacterium]